MNLRPNQADPVESPEALRGGCRDFRDGGSVFDHTGACYITVATAIAVCTAGCDGVQSALDPAGRDAERLAQLFYWMAGGAAVIWLLVIGLAVYAAYVQPGPHPRQATIMIIGGGAVVPTIVLGVLLVYGLALLPDLLAPAPPGSMKIAVTGEQWWWRVRYEPPGAEPFTLANEIRVAVGEPVEFELDASDVIHSFWVPPLGGKMDMFPGRSTRLTLHPTRTGIFRGACAEYCGASHALMSFYVVVQEPEELDRWMQQQAEPAQTPEQPLAIRGQDVFLSSGCGACHTIRGTPARGVVGPDLTHVGGRLSLGAGILENEPAEFLRWIARTEAVKPGVHMPAFGMLPQGDLRALAAYLNGLE